MGVGAISAGMKIWAIKPNTALRPPLATIKHLLMLIGMERVRQAAFTDRVWLVKVICTLAQNQQTCLKHENAVRLLNRPRFLNSFIFDKFQQ